MITVANRIPIKPEYARAFEDRFLSRPGMVENQPGFISYHLLRPAAEGDPYVVLTFRESQELYESWVNSEDFQQRHTGPKTLPMEAFAGRNKVELHQVIARK